MKNEEGGAGAFVDNFLFVDTEEEYLAAGEKMAINIQELTPDRRGDFLFNEVEHSVD